LSRAPWALGLALAAALAWGCHERSERLRQEGAYGILAAQADSLAGVAHEATLEAETAQVREAAVRLSAEVQQDSAVARAVRAASRRPAIVERVVLEAGADSAVVRAAVEEVVDSVVATEVVPLRAALAQAELRIASWDREAAALELANMRHGDDLQELRESGVDVLRQEIVPRAGGILFAVLLLRFAGIGVHGVPLLPVLFRGLGRWFLPSRGLKTT
jgi:hypothetical protein